MKHPRNFNTYRAARRNKFFGRKSVGNTKPAERRVIWSKQTPASVSAEELSRIKLQEKAM